MEFVEEEMISALQEKCIDQVRPMKIKAKKEYQLQEKNVLIASLQEQLAQVKPMQGPSTSALPRLNSLTVENTRMNELLQLTQSKLLEAETRVADLRKSFAAD